MRAILRIACLCLVGCGPLTKPMVDRLDEESQQHVDEAWANMLKPPDRLDRTLLLDVILVTELHQRGVDYLRMLSEKQVGQGRVVMDIRFRRDDPAGDEFSIIFIDADGSVARRERYTSQEIAQRVEFFHDRPLLDGSAEASCQDEASLQALRERHEAEINARLEEIRAATQPCPAP